MNRQLHEGLAGHHERRRPDSEPMEVATGLPQGSPISPVLFAIYIADIRQAVESQVEGSRGTSSVDDDVTWIVEGTDLDDVVDKLER